MLAGNTFLEGSLALGLSRADLALVSDGLIGFVNPQIGLHLLFVMAWLRALQTSSGPLPQGPGREGLTCLTLACLDAHAWAGASEERAVCSGLWQQLTDGARAGLCAGGRGLC